MADPAPFSEVLSKEGEQLEARRKALELPSDAEAPAATKSEVQAEEATPERRRDPALRRSAIEAHELRPLGVCLSGGGIRSATFNLGILQGLTERGVLPFIDYLSTVSGGGYIGTWLHGVIRRKCQGDPKKAASVISPTVSPTVKQAGQISLQVAKPPGDPTDDPIAFLRKYSNYLAPRLGLFSADFWVIGVIWIRNMLLNQLILIPFLAGIVLVAIHAGFLQQELAGIFVNPRDWLATWVAAGVLLAAATWIVAANLRAIVKREFDPHPETAPASSEPLKIERFWVIWTCVGFVLGAALLVGCSRFDPIPWGFAAAFDWPDCLPVALTFAVLLAMFEFLQGYGGFKTCFENQHRPEHNYWWVHFLWIPPVCAAATTAVLSGILHFISQWPGDETLMWHTIAWGPPLAVLVVLAGATIQIGLMGADFPDATREWLARLAALLSIACTGWMALFAIGVFGPKWISSLAQWSVKAVAGLGGGWIATTIAGVLAGQSARTNGTGSGDETSGVLEWIGKIAPTVFMIGYLLAVSFAVHAIIAFPELELGHYWQAYLISTPGAWGTAAVLAGCCAALVLLLPLRININEFSMNHFYKNRLVRCYLGASRADVRRPNPFTGFDPRDDIPIAGLRAEPGAPGSAYFGPYPIVNTTLNLNTGSELAQQERKGASFIFSPLYCGFDPPHSREDDGAIARRELSADGYRETEHYMYPAMRSETGGPGIGTGMGISGAAANPDWGYHTSGPMAFLMTIFDVRLGWWAGNPRKDKPSGRPGPLYGLGALLSDLFAQTNGRSKYLNLSDGGHFDNLGLYELVKRRCRYIVVCDSEADPDLTFESLGGAIRKCRIDFGVEIDLDPKQIRAAGGFSRTHCAVGSVSYPEVTSTAVDLCGHAVARSTGPTKGWILYLKASLTGDEPEDVTQYHAEHPAFPHESTMDQFFTESQFESYRRLGLHVVESAFEEAGEIVTRLKDENDKRPGALTELFQELFRQWYPPSTVAEGVATRHAEAYSALMKRLSDDPELGAYLDGQIIEAKNSSGPLPGADDAVRRRAFYYCLDLIQLMENVWSDLHLYQKADYENPQNIGWRNVFRHWVSQPAFEDAWRRASYTFNPLFQQFYEKLKTDPRERPSKPA